MFRRNKSPQSSGSTSKSIKTTSRKICQVEPSFLIGSFFQLEDGGDIISRKFGWLSKFYTATSQMIIHSTTTAARTSYTTWYGSCWSQVTGLLDRLVSVQRVDHKEIVVCCEERRSSYSGDHRAKRRYENKTWRCPLHERTETEASGGSFANRIERFINCGEFFYKLSDYQVLKKDSAPRLSWDPLQHLGQQNSRLWVILWLLSALDS
jgi:hypothetical protein